MSNKTPIKIGSRVIINDVDRPCTRLIAEVFAIVGQTVKARYINNGERNREVWGTLDYVTDVNDFTNDKMTTKAFYPNGKPRVWQEE